MKQGDTLPSYPRRWRPFCWYPGAVPSIAPHNGPSNSRSEADTDKSVLVRLTTLSGTLAPAAIRTNEAVHTRLSEYPWDQLCSVDDGRVTDVAHVPR
jgi:hypothetical protein